MEFRKIDGRWFVQLSRDESSDPDSDSDSAFSKKLATKIPNKPVSGTLLGHEFKPDQFELSPGPGSAIITISQGKEWWLPWQVKLHLDSEDGESLAGKTWSVSPRREPFRLESVSASEGREDIDDIENVVRKSYRTGYTLFLEFAEANDGRLTGRIYLALPDEQKSEIAGTFNLERTDQPTQPSGDR